jgi:hypothetical protein
MLAHSRCDGDTFCNDQSDGVDGYADRTRRCRLVARCRQARPAAVTVVDARTIAHCARRITAGYIDLLLRNDLNVVDVSNPRRQSFNPPDSRINSPPSLAASTALTRSYDHLYNHKVGRN